MTETRSIADLQDLVLALPAPERDRLARIYHITTTTGYLKAPETMHPWIRKQFAALAEMGLDPIQEVENQKIVRVTNLITLEAALYNRLRSLRPMECCTAISVDAEIAKTGDPFCKPLELTPEDVFGRVRGERCITASNVAKYDGFHGLAIFDEHNPLRFTAEGIDDAFRTALNWARKAHNADNAARYFFFMWNCLWRAGASIIHGHAQMMLGRGIHYGRIEHLRRAALLYRLAHGSSYFDDLAETHRSLGLAMQRGHIQILAHLTPLKEKEVLLIGQRLDRDMTDALYYVLDTFVNCLGVHSFNVAVYLRPIDAVQEDWTGFPPIIRIVDRGELSNRTCDIGCMELYAASVISSDPFQVMAALERS